MATARRHTRSGNNALLSLAELGSNSIIIIIIIIISSSSSSIIKVVKIDPRSLIGSLVEAADALYRKTNRSTQKRNNTETRRKKK